MILSRMLAVLLSLIVVVSCRSPQASSDTPWYTEEYYRVKEIPTVSSDGSILIELADDELNNRSNTGATFWVHIRRLSVVFDPDTTGTLIWVRAKRGVGNEADLSSIYETRIIVRKEEQKKEWEDFLEKEKDRIYGPRDVLPTEPNRPNR